MAPTRFGVIAFCAASLQLSSSALAQDANIDARTSGSALPKDVIAGTIYSPDGITHIVGDGMGGGFMFGPDGLTTFLSNGTFGGTLYAPNTTGVIIGDGLGGGILYSPQRIQPSYKQETGTPGRYMPALLLILLVAAIGIGSFIFNAVAKYLYKPANNPAQPSNIAKI
jgi:hypothetical protein